MNFLGYDANNIYLCGGLCPMTICKWQLPDHIPTGKLPNEKTNRAYLSAKDKLRGLVAWSVKPFVFFNHIP